LKFSVDGTRFSTCVGKRVNRLYKSNPAANPGLPYGLHVHMTRTGSQWTFRTKSNFVRRFRKPTRMDSPRSKRPFHFGRPEMVIRELSASLMARLTILSGAATANDLVSHVHVQRSQANVSAAIGISSRIAGRDIVNTIEAAAVLLPAPGPQAFSGIRSRGRATGRTNTRFPIILAGGTRR
jgi:hypothetical protein